ncbi:hypothetical protein L226DRAFT_241128 [Lentinus tigrinus ALCF2SS1-7]|uniref:uncharacterized protein n=1 Tax=Lentinus tigrinus ALCF2SS1-7 TaxID=1328758 RepID=UPI001165F296|nr:hypothetical protein L226DRAFT_241128 [Lentinus tigrinus ALCF2SS1-7]
MLGLPAPVIIECQQDRDAAYNRRAWMWRGPGKVRTTTSLTRIGGWQPPSLRTLCETWRKLVGKFPSSVLTVTHFTLLGAPDTRLSRPRDPDPASDHLLPGSVLSKPSWPVEPAASCWTFGGSLCVWEVAHLQVPSYRIGNRRHPRRRYSRLPPSR